MDKKLIQLLEVEFKYGRKPSTDYFLMESRGYVSNLYLIIEAIGLKIDEAVNYDYEKHKTHHFKLTASDMPPALLEKCFFTDFNMDVTITINPRLKNVERGGLDVNSVNVENGQATFDLYVYLASYGRENTLRRMNSILAHELLHANEEIGKKKRGVQTDMSVYRNIADTDISPNGLKRTIGTVLYYTNATERRAFIGQCAAELADRKEEINNSEDAARIIRETEAWKNYVSTLNVCYSMATYLDDTEQAELLTYFNELSPHKAKTFDQMMSYLIRVLRRFEDEFYKQVPKMVYDAFCSRESVTFMYEDFHRLF